MAENEKKNNLVAVAGEDPANPRTKGAIVTIYNNGVSVYHLSPKDAQTIGMDGALAQLGIIQKPDVAGVFRHSQEKGSPDRDPLKLIEQVDKISAEFAGGKLKRVTLSGDAEIPVSDTRPAKPTEPAASAPQRRADTGPSFNPMG